jgi:multiple sugar transport system ATP-binding protein
MAEILLDQVNKVYPGGVKGVDDLNLEIKDGEFMVLVGPSGCGKTTALRSIAGLEEISSGTITIGGRVVNDLPPKDRDIAMVFQNYALYPHMTVAQRQRVAMGRAIVREPQAFLMDEPLSNLDAKLRVSMRASLTQLHERLGVTTVYVTHDQVEAMTLGHRVCVLRDGRLQQVDTPQTLFDTPVNLFVGGFIGSPAMNIINAELVRDDGLPLPAGLIDAKPGLDSYFGREVILGVRPSDFEDAQLADSGWARMSVRANVTEELGSEIHVIFSVDAPPVRHESISEMAGDADEEEAAAVLAEGKSLWTARVAARSHVRSGQPCELAVDTSNLQFFDPVSALSIGHPAASEVVTAGETANA